MVGHPTEHKKNKDGLFCRVIWMGIIKENLPHLGYPDISEMASHTSNRSHSTVHNWHKKWLAMPWQQRHGWLLLAEMKLGSDTGSIQDNNWRTLLETSQTELPKTSIEELKKIPTPFIPVLRI